MVTDRGESEARRASPNSNDRGTTEVATEVATEVLPSGDRGRLLGSESASRCASAGHSLAQSRLRAGGLDSLGERGRSDAVAGAQVGESDSRSRVAKGLSFGTRTRCSRDLDGGALSRRGVVAPRRQTAHGCAGERGLNAAVRCPPGGCGPGRIGGRPGEQRGCRPPHFGPRGFGEVACVEPRGRHPRIPPGGCQADRACRSPKGRLREVTSASGQVRPSGSQVREGCCRIARRVS